MTEITLVVNDVPRRVAADISLAAALLNIGNIAFRADLHGGVRAPLCAMGTCFECRVTVDGVANVRACLSEVRDGMTVETAR